MTYNTDSHFVIGRYHIRQNKPCQDHALDCTQESEKVACVVISDGCSSGDHTDIGARVITCSAIHGLGKGWFNPHHVDSPRFIKTAIADKMITSMNSLSLSHEDMLATCSYALLDERGGFVHMIGDGCLAIKYKNGDIDMVVLDWQNNTPYYLSYLLRDQENFIQAHEKIKGGTEALKVTISAMSGLGEPLHNFSQFKPLPEAVNGYVVNINTTDNIDCIAIFSDGVQDFQKNETERISVEKVVYEMMSFKNYTGEFVKRRVSAALKKFAKDDIHPNDDFSMAVIHFDHDTTESL